MVPTTTYIPRFLLPQYGSIWRSSARAGPFARPLHADVGQVLVRYASKKAGGATAKPAAPAKVTPPKTAPTTKPPTAWKPATPGQAATPKTPTSASTPKAAATAAPVDPSKPIVLEKPERFNPPSHGARLPRSTPKHYGGPLTHDEIQTQKTKDYPGLPPPPNTWSHWFINNRHIHMFITLGTLTSLAVYTFVAKFNATSPFADLIPPISEFPKQPINYIRTCVEVLKLHEQHESAVTAEKRKRRVDDVAKRNEYRKAHGLSASQGIDEWTGTAKSPTQAEQEAAAAAAAAPPPVAVVNTAEAPSPDLGLQPDGKRKKFLGIF